jgi:hypothetical protein
VHANEISLGEFIKQLTLKIQPLRVEMPFAEEQPWHRLFYELKKESNAGGKPGFLAELFFDWNGRYPRSQELSDYIHALHYTGCMSATNPQYDKIDVNEDVAKLWSEMELDAELSAYLDHAAQLAKERFAPVG